MLSEPLVKTYPAIFRPEKGGGYFIEFPDIQGAYTGINEVWDRYGTRGTRHGLSRLY